MLENEILVEQATLIRWASKNGGGISHRVAPHLIA
jgi:hypothetical protein